MLAVRELWKAVVDDLVHQLVDEHEVHAEQLLIDSTAEVVDALLGQGVDTYVDDILEQFERQAGAEVPLETADDEVEFLLLDVRELDAIHLLYDCCYSTGATYEERRVPVLIVVVERVRDANALQEHVLRRRQPAILHFESD